MTTLLSLATRDMYSLAAIPVVTFVERGLDFDIYDAMDMNRPNPALVKGSSPFVLSSRPWLHFTNLYHI
jgi:hypothetical protein